MAEFFLRLPHTYKINILQKKMVKNDQPSPQKWPKENTDAYMGSHHQLDDQDKEPMVDTKII